MPVGGSPASLRDVGKSTRRPAPSSPATEMPLIDLAPTTMDLLEQILLTLQRIEAHQQSATDEVFLDAEIG